jgi:microcystin-dependent protein
MRATIVSNNVEVGNGLLVYDTAQKLFYFRDSEHKQWLALNPWRVSDATAVSPWKDVRLAEEYNERNVYIGNNTAASAEAKLHVSGTLQADGAVTAKNGVSVTGNAKISDTLKVSSGTITTTVTCDEVASGTITATQFVGYGTVPIGGIIMWSGTVPPNGWALCNGHKTASGHITPDLRGRFIVGYGVSGSDIKDIWDSSYENPGNLSIKKIDDPGATGGEREHTLTIDEMPGHTHEVKSRRPDGGGGNSGDYFGTVDEHSWKAQSNQVTLSEGFDYPHENRPPFYVLAFIMRIK